MPGPRSSRSMQPLREVTRRSCPGRERRGVERLRDQIALNVIAFGGVERSQLVRRFHTLGHGLHPQHMRQVDDGIDDRCLPGIGKTALG